MERSTQVVSSQNCKRKSCRSLRNHPNPQAGKRSQRNAELQPLQFALYFLCKLEPKSRVSRPRVVLVQKQKRATNQLSHVFTWSRKSLHNCTLLTLPDPRGFPLSSSHHDPSASIRSSLPLSVLITLLQSIHPFRALIPLVLSDASDPSSRSRPLPLDPLVLSYSTSRATQVPGITLTSSHSFGLRKRSTV